MDQISDKELSLSVELANTQRALFQMQLRAVQNESQLASIALQDTEARLRTLFTEQEARAKAKQVTPLNETPVA